MVESVQKPICSLTIQCPDTTEVCIHGQCSRIELTNNVWIFATMVLAAAWLVICTYMFYFDCLLPSFNDYCTMGDQIHKMCPIPVLNSILVPFFSMWKITVYSKVGFFIKNMLQNLKRGNWLIRLDGLEAVTIYAIGVPVQGDSRIRTKSNHPVGLLLQLLAYCFCLPKTFQVARRGREKVSSRQHRDSHGDREKVTLTK